MRKLAVAAALAGAMSFDAFTVSAAEQGAGYAPPDIALQKEKLAALAIIEGEWSGEGWTYGADGKKRAFTQTEEVAFMLDGAILTVHGTGRSKDAAPDAKPAFEAFAIISWDEKESAYRFRSYANGHYGEFPLTVLEEGGFQWSTPGGIHYEAAVKDGVWTEKGFRARPDGGSVQFFEMTVKRR